MLSLSGVSASIAGVKVLRQINAELPSAATVALVGRNGAGKTTLLRVVMGLLPMTEGTLRFDGEDLGKLPARHRVRLGIGYAPEDRVLFPSFSVEANLRFPCEVIGLSRAAVDARLEETLTIVPELKPLLPRSGAALSGGQGKMGALGRAVMAGSRLVLLDEPFQGLAPVLAAQYTEALHRLHTARPELCVLVTESNGSLLGNIPTHTLNLERGRLTLAEAASASA